MTIRDPARILLMAAVWLIALTSGTSRGAASDFETEIRPILESACLSCHNERKPEGGLRLDTRAAALAGGDGGPALIPSEPEASSLYALAVLPAEDERVMPPEGPPLDPSQVERLRQWIADGADWPEQATLQAQPRIDFVQHVQPILEQRCVSCHGSEEPEGDFDLTTRAKALQSGAEPPALIAFRPADSSLYALTVESRDSERLMPPSNAGGPLAPDITHVLKLWIAQGAVWPEGVTLQAKEPPAGTLPTPDNFALVQSIHELVVQRSPQAGQPATEDYSQQIPLTGATYHMVALAGGEFRMGSPQGEPDRQENEGPATKVQVDPFWIGKFEVTWDEYEPFMITQVDRAKNGARLDYDPNTHAIFDAVSQPTPPYVEMSFGMGQAGYPAISMTQHAANKYCQWLSAQTGHFYRLPTEAEWEYACRAGTETAYSFGDDPRKLGQHAWYYDNSDEKYHKVGQKKPNAWGLHDMHGNVMEWTADQFAADYFHRLAGATRNPILKPDVLYPRSVRGGGWDDDPKQLRSAFRRGSAPEWKQQDPQLPKSIWYHTDARWLGFRIVRPLAIPSAEEMYFYWNSAANKR